jgi:hypothetical protein
VANLFFFCLISGDGNWFSSLSCCFFFSVTILLFLSLFLLFSSSVFVSLSLLSVHSPCFSPVFSTVFPFLLFLAFSSPPRSLIFSGFIAREYQPFETTSLYSSNGSWGGRRRRRLTNSNTAPFVWWEYPFSIWSLKFWNHVLQSLGKL